MLLQLFRASLKVPRASLRRFLVVRTQGTLAAGAGLFVALSGLFAPQGAPTFNHPEQPEQFFLGPHDFSSSRVGPQGRKSEAGGSFWKLRNRSIQHVCFEPAKDAV